MVEAYWDLSNTPSTWKTYKIKVSLKLQFSGTNLSGFPLCVRKISLSDKIKAQVHEVYYQRVCVQIYRNKSIPK